MAGSFSPPPPASISSVRNGAVCRPVRSFSKVARQVRIKDEDGRHSVVPSGFSGTCLTHPSEGPSSTVPGRLPQSSAVFRCFPLFSAVPGRPLPSPTGICLTSWGLSSFLMTAVLGIQGRGRTAFCRPVQSFSQVARQIGMKDEDGPRFAVSSRPGLLAVPPPGPTGAPDGCEH